MKRKKNDKMINVQQQRRQPTRFQNGLPRISHNLRTGADKCPHACTRSPRGRSLLLSGRDASRWPMSGTTFFRSTASSHALPAVTAAVTSARAAWASAEASPAQRNSRGRAAKHQNDFPPARVPVGPHVSRRFLARKPESKHGGSCNPFSIHRNVSPFSSCIGHSSLQVKK